MERDPLDFIKDEFYYYCDQIPGDLEDALAHLLARSKEEIIEDFADFYYQTNSLGGWQAEDRGRYKAFMALVADLEKNFSEVYGDQLAIYLKERTRKHTAG